MVAQTRCDMKLYAERDIISQGQVYTNHVFQMTREGLHSKSDIAAELAYRDICIANLEAYISRLRTHIELTCKKWEGVPELQATVWNLQRIAKLKSDKQDEQNEN